MTEKIKAEDIQDIQAILKRATEGDTSVLPEVKKLVAAAPEVATKVGDVGKQVERALIDQIAGHDLLMKETIPLQLQAMYEQLAGPNPSYLEQMWAHDIVICYLQTRHEDLVATEYPPNDAGQKRQDRAHKRFLNAIHALARIRKLFVPAQVQVNVGHQVNAMQVETASVHKGA